MGLPSRRAGPRSRSGSWPCLSIRWPPIDRDDHLADQRAGAAEGVVLEQALGVGGLGQREGPADDRLEPAGLDPAVDVLGAAALLVGGRVEHREAQERAVAG